MRRLDILLYSRFSALAMAVLMVLALGASGAYAADSLQAERQKVIQQILDTNKNDPAALEASIKNIFGDLQGDEAVARAQQILDALPSEMSDAQWGAVKAAITAKSSRLVSPAASTAIDEKLAAKESALGKAVQQAKADSGDSAPAAKRQAPTPPPPQDEVVCVSAACN